VNTRQQGAIGIGRAIAYYSSKGYAVFTPVAGISRYDLIVDTGKKLLRVEVKTTTHARSQINLRTMGGNQSWNGTIKCISENDCDMVFAVNLTSGTEIEFPASQLAGKTAVTVR
jgi:hypothetical protein